jgi:membrane-associated phospholipid phosphatase
MLVLLALRDRTRPVLATLIVYAVAMWAATVVLNQHYVIDLIAGGLLAVAAWLAGERHARRAPYRARRRVKII